MRCYRLGDICLRWQGEYILERDNFTDRFALEVDPACECGEQLYYESVFFPLEQFQDAPVLEYNASYELRQTRQGKLILFHWAACRFGYGFLLDELERGDRVRCWFNPAMQAQPPLSAARFFTTAGLHAKLLQRGAPILHASYIGWKGRAILFAAPSQTGKSTQAELWRQHAGAEIINGDRVLLRRREGKWHAFGYPCCGSSQICLNRTLPLAAVVILAQGLENRVEEMRPAEKIRALVAGTEVLLWDKKELDRSFELAGQISSQVPVVRLVCRPDAQAVNTLKDYLEREGAF